MTWRPRYQPQFAHTVCGSFEAEQFGHSEWAAGVIRKFADRRAWVRERVSLRLGTAMRLPLN